MEANMVKQGQLCWSERKQLIKQKYSYLGEKDLQLIDCNASEFIMRLQFLTGLSRGEIINELEQIH